MCNSPQQNQSGQIYSCGKCKACHDKYIRQWVFRLQKQQYETPNCLFVTMTYDYAHIPMNKGKFTLRKSDYQKFLKRLRKALPNRNFKYVLCGEYGSNFDRPHYHMILFDIEMNDYPVLSAAWGMGHVHVGSVTPASIAYTFKYAVKGDLKHRDRRQLKQFVAMSKGLGESFAFDIQLKKVCGTDKNGNNFVRYAKIRTPKAHFQKKLDTLLQMPYYVIPNQNGGTVKMSIPKFYLRSANYDTTQLGELFADVMSKKYSSIPSAKLDAILKRQLKQREGAVMQQTKDRLYSISKEIM